jgi:acyl transferase domain-containing protein/aryl carrier-like protein
MERVAKGAMLSVALGEAEVRRLLTEDLSVAAVNAPKRCVVSGAEESVAVLERRLRADSIGCQRLPMPYAFHSKLVEPIMEEFREAVRSVQLNEPKIEMISGVTGQPLRSDEATDPEYWVRHMREPVRFSDALSELMKEEGRRIFLEVGPGRTLSTLVKQQWKKGAGHRTLASLPHPTENITDMEMMLTSLGSMWVSGTEVDWDGLYERLGRRRVPLPTYPFERKTYWINPRKANASDERPDAAAQIRRDLADWFYLPYWKPSLPPKESVGSAAEDGATRWLILKDELGVAERVAERLLLEENCEVVSVRAGDTFSKDGVDLYTINPQRPADFAELVRQLHACGQAPDAIAHLWSLTPCAQTSASVARSEDVLDCGFYSLLFLTQAIEEAGEGRPLRIKVVANDSQSVTGAEVICPEKAALLGPCKVIPQEHPNIKCQFIDVSLPAGGGEPHAEFISQLAAELLAEPVDALVAYRNFTRWVQAFEPVRLEAPEVTAPHIRDGGVYLITGGLGGIGLTLAGYLARAARAKLVLTGRSSFPARQDWSSWLKAHDPQDAVSRTIRELQSFEERGAEVLVLTADVTSPEEVREMVARTLQRFGVINGVVHAAGVAGGGLIRLKSREMAERVLAPKILGARNLVAALAGERPDFLLLCSSLLAITGKFGQVDYCGANAFLDAFAHQCCNEYALPTTSLNLDAWREVGMSVNAAAPAWLAQIQHQGSQTAPAHPLLGARAPAGSAGEAYQTELRVSDHWVLSEHRVMGMAAMPGTALLEMARAAYEKNGRDGAVEIRSVFFLTPLFVAEGESKQVRTLLEKSEDGWSFRIQSALNGLGVAEAVWKEHVRGELRPLGREPRQPYEAEDVMRRCTEQETVVQTKGADGFVSWGARWRNLKTVCLGKNEAVAVLELPDEFVADLKDYKLHPSLLDVAVSFARQVAGEGNFLPLSYKSLRVYEGLPARIRSIVTFSDDDLNEKEGTLTFDAVLTDEGGNVLVEVDGFTMKRSDGASATPARALGANGRGADATPQPESDGMRQRDNRSSAPARAARGSAEEAGPAEGITPTEGIEVFKRILSQRRLPQVVVSTRDLGALIEQAAAFTRSQILKQIGELQLPVPRHSRPEMRTLFAAPESPLEQNLADIWQSVLGIERVGVHDDFFELGGDSVLVFHVIDRVRSLNYSLTPEQFFKHPTISELARVMSSKPTPDTDAQPAGSAAPPAPDQARAGLTQQDLDTIITQLAHTNDKIYE